MIKCVVIDDEPWALALIEDYVKKTPFLELIYSTTKPIEAINFLQENKVDLVFSDIQMKELTGIQLMKIAGERCRYILTTAYSEYAMEGYEHNVLDYLLKPITYERFLIAAAKGKDYFSNGVTGSANEVKQKDFIFLKTDNRLVRLLLDDILFIEGLRDYISVQTKTEKLIVLENLKNLENELPGNLFMRVHKSFIVALNKIEIIERNRIFIRKHIIPIGETYKSVFFNTIDANRFG
jgi:two-component system, LytTR family, response regulator